MRYLLFISAILLSANAHAFNYDATPTYQECKILKGIWKDKDEGVINHKYFIRDNNRIFFIHLYEMRKHLTNEQEQFEYMVYALESQKHKPDPCRFVRER